MADVNARRTLCTLIAAAFVDGKFDATEKAVVYRRGRELGFTPQEMDDLIELGRKGALAVSVPPTQKQKEDLFDDLIDIACADGRLEPPEQQLLMKFAGQLAISVQDLGARVRRRIGQGRKPQAAVAAEPVMVIDDAPAPVTHKVEPRPAPKAPGAPRTAPTPVDLMSAPPRPIGSEDVLGRMAEKMKEEYKPLPPGPVQLSGPTLASDALGAKLGVIAADLVKQRIIIEGRGGAARYLREYCGIPDDAQAAAIVEEMLRKHPEIKPGMGQASLA